MQVHAQRFYTAGPSDIAGLEARDDHHGATPLSWAAWFGCREGLRALLAAGASPDAEDSYGCARKDPNSVQELASARTRASACAPCARKEPDAGRCAC